MPDGLLRHWIEPEALDVPPDFQSAIGGHALVAQVLVRRGLSDLNAARAFLDPRQYIPTGPEALPGMEAACQRIEQAIQAGERLCVWGDFDVDGQSSTTLLVSALRGLGANVSYHIPVRARESHGVNWEHLQPILESGVSLVVTCDTGISANEALEQAHRRGIDVIVTDHHDLPDVLPPAQALINPKFLSTDHPLSGLPGVGVAFKLAEALYQRASRTADIVAFLDLVALGIVADVAMQTDDTRYLLQRGLPVLREARRVGLQQMFELSGLQPSNLTEEHIGFVLGPRLNALGRLDDANTSVELLTTSDAGRARILATHLEGLNARRRLLTDQVLRGALAQIEKDPALLDQAVLVLAHPEWPAGVIGIVASELAGRYNRPTLLLASPPGEPARGSARSIEGVNITAAIAAQKHLLLGFGGHPMAAGLSLDSDKIMALRRGLSRFVEKASGGAALRPTLAIAGDLTLPELSLNLVADFERLAPFGPGNPPLALAIRNLSILSSTNIGRDGDHLQVIVKDEFDRSKKVIWWRGAGWPLPEGRFDLACVVRASDYRGQRDVQVEWLDARPVDNGSIDLRRQLTVIDQRDQTHPLPVLHSLLAEASGQILVWAEADAQEKLASAPEKLSPAPEKLVSAPEKLVYAPEKLSPAPGGNAGAPVERANHAEKRVGQPITTCDRAALGARAAGPQSPVETLLIWTTPPGRAELQAVMDAIHPASVVVFAVDPAATTAETFLKRLAGMVKYAQDKRGGQAALIRLAAAAAQREAAVRLGLQWLEARGMCRVQFLADHQVQFTAGTTADPARASALLDQVRLLLDETAAYRRYFRSAEKENLI